eukprot:2942112-Prymnesium_polylepis.1
MRGSWPLLVERHKFLSKSGTEQAAHSRSGRLVCGVVRKLQEGKDAIEQRVDQRRHVRHILEFVKEGPWKVLFDLRLDLGATRDRLLQRGEWAGEPVTCERRTDGVCVVVGHRFVGGAVWRSRRRLEPAACHAPCKIHQGAHQLQAIIGLGRIRRIAAQAVSRVGGRAPRFLFGIIPSMCDGCCADGSAAEQSQQRRLPKVFADVVKARASSHTVRPHEGRVFIGPLDRRLCRAVVKLHGVLRRRGRARSKGEGPRWRRLARDQRHAHAAVIDEQTGRRHRAHASTRTQ